MGFSIENDQLMDHHDERTILRLLQAEDPTTVDLTNHSAILRTTFQVYGTILLVSYLIFCHVRQHYPKAYTIRDWADDIKVKI
jgi:hypothetical protein